MSTHAAPVTDIELIVYDMDGTLVDAFEDIWTGLNQALRRFNLPELPYETVRSHVGDGARMLVRRCLGETHADRFDDVYPAYLDYYISHPARSVRTFPGVLETLDRLRAIGLRQALLTNKPHAVTIQTARHLDLTQRLDGVWGEQADEPRKPDPDALLRVMRHFNLEPAQCVMVGDGQADHKVARSCGTYFIGVTYGLLTSQQIRTLRPDAVIDRMEELPEALRLLDRRAIHS